MFLDAVLLLYYIYYYYNNIFIIIVVIIISISPYEQNLIKKFLLVMLEKAKNISICTLKILKIVITKQILRSKN